MSRSQNHLAQLDQPVLCKAGKITVSSTTQRGRCHISKIELDFTIGDVGKAKATSLQAGRFKNLIQKLSGITNTGLTLTSPKGMSLDNWAGVVNDYRREFAERLNKPVHASGERRAGRTRDGRKMGPSWNSPFNTPLSRSNNC